MTSQLRYGEAGISRDAGLRFICTSLSCSDTPDFSLITQITLIFCGFCAICERFFSLITQIALIFCGFCAICAICERFFSLITLIALIFCGFCAICERFFSLITQKQSSDRTAA